MANKNILLIEPGYKNKYPPLGLMKIAQYHGQYGKQDSVTFVKGEDPSVFSRAWDRVYVTTLFSFEFPKIAKSIDYALRAAHKDPSKVFVGGIAASLMHERFVDEPRWHGIRFIKGLLGDAPAKSLQLDDFAEELYSEDVSSPPIEDLVPDYSILDQIPYTYPVRDAYFAYASRGCIRKCSFCGVPKLEGDLRDMAPLSALVAAIDERYGKKKDLILMDNNIVASPRFKEVIAEIRDLGFVPGAKLERGKVPVKRRVDFNQGVDARILSKDRMYLRELASICIRPLRIAFDHLGLKGPYEQAVRFANEFGLNDLSNYMLYNFHDTPLDLYERMHLNVRLNEELGIRIYSFPMRYQPTNRPDRGFVGEKWTRYQLRSMQIVLQATHGVVSGEPSFFRKAFGSTAAEFIRILEMPHHFIFNRDWYEHEGGSAELSEYWSAYKRCDESERRELLEQLSAVSPSKWATLEPGLPAHVRDLLRFYYPPSREQELVLWRRNSQPSCNLTEDEIVEDAGLDDADDDLPAKSVA